MEQGKGAKCESKSMVSRRATRMFVEEQKFMEVVTGGHELRSMKGDETEQERIGRRTSNPSTTIDVRQFPVVDIGKDLSNAFPTTTEDMGKQVAKGLQAAKVATKERTDNRPINFGEVIPGRIYRSSFPIEEDFQFLKTLGLKTVVSLVKKDFSPEFQGFIKDNAITHRVIDMQGTKKVDIPEHIMKAIMEIVLDKENYPVLIHCNHGKHRTGCAVGVIRYVAGWKSDEIVEEYCGYAAPKVRDCDVKYLSEYQVSTLRHLFAKHDIHPHQPVLASSKMAQLVIITVIVLAVWITSLLW